MAKRRRSANRVSVVDPLTDEGLDVGEAFERLAEYEAEMRVFRRDAAKAWKRVHSVKRADTQQKWTEEYQFASDQFTAYRSAREQIASALESIPVDGGDVEPPTPEKPLRGVDRSPNDEWEMGLMYDLAKNYNNVDINLRVRRTDGQRMTKDDARAAFETWIATGVDEPGYAVVGINWQRPNWDQPTEGDVTTDGVNLFGPMYAALVAGRVRLGWAKREADDGDDEG